VTRFGNIATTRPNFNYFGHSHNYDAIIRNFILLVWSILHLSINRLICPISCNNHQISYILEVFYNDIWVYFNVCIKIIYIICIRMYIVHIMNLKINIWTLNFLFKSKNCYFNCLKHYLNLKFLIWIWYFQLKIQKGLFDLKSDIWILN
jgi:hypothetical protein